MKVRGNMELEGRRRWLGLLAATLALPGCVSMGPRPEPRQALPADWDNRGEAPVRTEAPPRWWTAFEDAELDALAERALAGNLTLAQAAQRLKAARALSRSSAAQALPQIGLHGAAQRQHRLSGPHGANELSGAEAGQGELPLAQEERSIGYYQAGFDARWELDLFGRIAAATDAARASAGAAEADLRAARVSVAAEAVRAYIELRGAQRRHQVLSGLLGDQRHLLALVQERRRAGIASDFDVDRASVLEAETAAQLPLSAQLARQHAQRLAVLTGESQIAPGLLASAGQPLPRGEPTAPLPADIVRVRPDIRRAEQQVLQAAAELRVSIAELYPRLTLSGDIQITGNLTGKPLPGRSTHASGGLSLTLPLLDWGLRRAVAGAREAELAAAILGYRQVVLEAVEETENALGAWAAQERRAQRIDAQLQASRRADAHAGLLYGRGMINLLERLNASVGHRQAELAAVEASEGRALAFVAVNKATGGGGV